MKEFSLISEYFKPLAKEEEGSLDLKDDAAFFSANDGEDYISTLDTICEGVHFLKDSSPEVVANRLVIPNLSDLASCGAKPLYYLMTGNITNKQNEEWYRKFCEQLSKLQKEYNFTLLGGDTVKAKNDDIFLSATFIGKVKKGEMLKRSGAKINDDIYVSGKIGGGYLGLQALLKKQDFGKDNASFIKYYESPTAEIELGQMLVSFANSCTDISDGLVKDLNNICKASDKSAKIYLEKVPLYLEVKLVEEQLCGGDDYKLIFTANKDKENQIEEISKQLGIKITKIGKITDDKAKKIVILDANFNPVNFKFSGYEH